MEAKAAADNATLQAQAVNDMMPDAIKKTEDTLKRAQILKGKVEGTEKGFKEMKMETSDAGKIFLEG